MAIPATAADRSGTQHKGRFGALMRLPVFSILIILFLILTAIFANFVAPYSPYDTSLPDKLKPPFWVQGGSADHLLGTDLLGRDVLSRIIFGSRTSLFVAFMGIIVAGGIGALLGMLSGFYGGKVDALIMRTCDATLSLPIVLVALLLAVVFGAGLMNLIYIMGMVLWARYARVVRGEVLSWKEYEFIAYARVAGCSNLTIMLRHLFPNVVNTLMVLITFQTSHMIILEAGLSFLGAGVPPPTPTWGGMVAEGRGYIVSGWWLSVFSGLAIMLVVLALNLLGDWLRDHLDPKLRQA